MLNISPQIRHLYDLLDRRELFQRTAAGFTGLALASLLGDSSARGEISLAPHHKPRAKAVIQLFMHGGPSHMDLLDPKPELTKRDGQPMPDSFTDLVKISAHGNLMKSPFKFAPAGECGVEYSEVMPHVAGCADDIAVIRSMHCEHNNHEQALWQMHTGRIVSGRPSIGSWVTYALGAETENLPAYVVLRNDSSLPTDGARNWSSGFLPPKYQGVHFRHTGTPVLYLNPTTPVSTSIDNLRRDLLKTMNADHLLQHPRLAPQLEARIASYELAGRMQLHAAEALELAQETKETHDLYGIGSEKTDSYARRCLIARRLVERGVRYVQIFVAGQIWDTHGNNAVATRNCCEKTDQPAAALIKDLKQRGMLDDVLIVWGGEFGRTPVSQSGDGRDHHKQGFSVWMAGGGIKGGQAYGATDELGYYAVEKPTMVADLHATILHQLGLDHERVTYNLNGRDERLTDVYPAKVIDELIA
ncbi:MAG: DUF1501 domain-containing protein [Planctomycetota bacterium]|nr:DUF1501 domain-containing protein [Planctomycetota bacterium]MDA1211424.1 DUF1501 domain-containing protein [Planctomycetota bacterium]